MSFDIHCFNFDRARDTLSQEASTLRLSDTPRRLIVRGRLRDADYELWNTMYDATHEDILAWEYISTSEGISTKVVILND